MQPNKTQNEIENVNSSKAIKENKSIIKIFCIKKTLGSDSFIGEVYQTFKKEITEIFLLTPLKLFSEDREDMLLKSFYEASITVALKPENKHTHKESKFRDQSPLRA